MNNEKGRKMEGGRKRRKEGKVKEGEMEGGKRNRKMENSEVKHNHQHQWERVEY